MAFLGCYKWGFICLLIVCASDTVFQSRIRRLNNGIILLEFNPIRKYVYLNRSTNLVDRKFNFSRALEAEFGYVKSFSNSECCWKYLCTDSYFNEFWLLTGIRRQIEPYFSSAIVFPSSSSLFSIAAAVLTRISIHVSRLDESDVS